MRVAPIRSLLPNTSIPSFPPSFLPSLIACFHVTVRASVRSFVRSLVVSFVLCNFASLATRRNQPDVHQRARLLNGLVVGARALIPFIPIYCWLVCVRRTGTYGRTHVRPPVY